MRILSINTGVECFFCKTAQFIFIIYMFLHLSSGIAQKADSAKGSKDTSQTSVSILDIGQEADQSLATIQDILSQLSPMDNIQSEKRKIDELSKQINQSRNYFRSHPLQNISINGLINQQKQWTRLSQQLDQQKKYLESRSKILQSGLKNISDMQKQWKGLEKNISQAKFPQTQIPQIQTLSTKLNDAENQLKNRAEILLSMSNILSDKAIIVSDIQNQLNQAIEEAQVRLFEPDRPPLWQAWGSKATSSFESELSIYHSESLGSFIKFARDNKSRILLHFSIFLIVLVVVYDLRRRSRTWLEKDNTSHQSVVLILSRPISVAFLIALSLSTTIYPNAPSEIFRFLNTIMIIPLLRILPGLLPRILRKPLYYLVLLFILNQLHDQAFEQMLLQRILLLIMTIATLGWAFWLVKPGGPVFKLGEGRLLRNIILIGRISLVLLIIGILGNVFGYVSLANLITSAFLKSIYIGIALYTILRILEALLTLIMKTKIAQSLQMVRRHSTIILSRLQIFLQFSAFLLWLYAMLNYYTVFNPLWKFVSSILNKKLVVGNLNISLGHVIAFILTIWISILISRFIRFILDEDVYPRLKLSRGVPATISLLINYSIITLGFVAAISAAGMEWSRLAILAGALGVGIGFGLQNLVNNFVSGLILIFERPIKVGDIIEFGNLLGKVLRIGIRSSTVRTYEGAEVIVPNGNIISSEVVNWTLSDKLRRIEILVGVAYGANPEKVIDILKGIASAHDSILKNPEPIVLFTEFGDSSLNFSLRFWTANFDEWLNLKSEITVLVNKALNDANIEIPFPQRDLHLRSVDPEISKEFKAKNKKSED